MGIARHQAMAKNKFCSDKDPSHGNPGEGDHPCGDMN